MHTLIAVVERLDTIETRLVQLRDDLAWIVNVVERMNRAVGSALEEPIEGEWREPLGTSKGSPYA